MISNLLNSVQIINKTKTSKPLLKTELNGGRREIKNHKIPERLGKNRLDKCNKNQNKISTDHNLIWPYGYYLLFGCMS